MVVGLHTIVERHFLGFIDPSKPLYIRLYGCRVIVFTPAMSIIDTEGRRQQKIQSLSAIEQMIICCLDRGYVLSSHDSELPLSHQNRELVPADVLYKEASREFSSMYGFPDTALKFGQALHKVMGETLEKILVGRVQEHCKKFAGLATCRAHMNKYLVWEYFEADAEDLTFDPTWWVIRWGGRCRRFGCMVGCRVAYYRSTALPGYLDPL